MQLEVGQIIEGKITGITNFGAFVDIDNNTKSGMVHISEVSNAFVKNINDFLQIGQKIKAKIINISEKGEIGLSIKKLDENNSFRKNNAVSKNDFEKNSNSNKFSNFEWQAPKKKNNASFEDMLSMFKSASEEKMSDLKRVTDCKRGNSSRRGFQNRVK